MWGEELTTAEELNEINEHTSKAIKRDIRTYNEIQIEQTIENIQSMKVLHRKLDKGEKQMTRIKNKHGSIWQQIENIS